MIAESQLRGKDELAVGILGEAGNLKIYTQISLIFELKNDLRNQEIVNIFERGLKRLAANFPWTTGKVAPGTFDPTKLTIQRFEHVPQLNVKILTDGPTFTEIKAQHFPFRLLDESVVAPCSTIPGPSDKYGKDLSPVFLVQLTFIKGGLIVTILGEHTTMDMTGQGFVMDMLSKACRGEEFTEHELEVGNLPRDNMIPILDYDSTNEVSHQIIQPSDIEPPAPVHSKWVYFSFSSDSIRRLKGEASKSIDTKYISKDDALTALLWRSITRARLPRVDGPTTTKLARAVDVRRYLNVPLDFPGLLQNMAYHVFTADELTNMPIGQIASDLRRAVDPKTSQLAHSTSALATAMHRASDKNKISVTACLKMDLDIAISSWSKTDCYSLDFGLDLGKPVSVRRPQFVPYEGLLYLLPIRPDGEITAAVCLRDEDLNRLLHDETFSTYASYIP